MADLTKEEPITKPDEPVSLTRDASVVKTVLQPGDGDPAGRGAHVRLTYTLRLSEAADAEVVDSSAGLREGVLKFTTGRNKVIAALDLAAQSMRAGERASIRSAPKHAFGTGTNAGAQRRGVQSDATVYLEVEMLSFEGGEKVKALADMTPAERFEKAKVFKEEGNQLFKEVKFEKAMLSYTQCIRLLSNIFYKADLIGKKAAATPEAKPKTDAETSGGDENSDKNVPNEDTTQDADAKSVDVRLVEQATEVSADAEEEGDEEKANEEKGSSQPDESGFDEAEIITEDGANGTETVPVITTDPKLIEQTGEDKKEVEEEETEKNDEEVEVIDVSTASRTDEQDSTAEQSKDDNTESENAIPNGNGRAEGDTEGSTKDAGTEAETGAEAEAEDEEEEDAPEEKEIKALHVTTLNNLSLCLIKMEEYRRAVESASMALRLDNGSSKALYYRGRALEALGEWDKARDDLTAAAKIQPNNVGIRMEIAKLEKKRKVHHSLERKQAAAMFA